MFLDIVMRNCLNVKQYCFPQDKTSSELSNKKAHLNKDFKYLLLLFLNRHSCAGEHTHANFDFWIVEHDVSEGEDGLLGGVVDQQAGQADQVVLGERIAVLGVVQPQRHPSLWGTHTHTHTLIMGWNQDQHTNAPETEHTRPKSALVTDDDLRLV